MAKKKPKYSILIVDDDRDMCASLADVISLDTDYETVSASNPQKAIEIVRKRTFSLLLIDYKMPIMNGLETIHKIRAVRPELPIIILTAFLSAELVEEASRENVLRVLSKFIWPDELLRQIDAAVGKNT
jgi:DNA-binding NtrC family response regulator